MDEAAAAVEALAALDRALCRRSFEGRFTAARMAKNYIGVYDVSLAGPYPPKAAGRCPRRAFRFLCSPRVRRGSLSLSSTKPGWVGHDPDERGGAPFHRRPLNQSLSAVFPPPKLK